jgi:hypothetical protein
MPLGGASNHAVVRLDHSRVQSANPPHESASNGRQYSEHAVQTIHPNDDVSGTDTVERRTLARAF